jgi:hypothetical protein
MHAVYRQKQFSLLNIIDLYKKLKMKIIDLYRF